MNEDSHRMEGVEGEGADAEVASPKPGLPWGRIAGGGTRTHYINAA